MRQPVAVVRVHRVVAPLEHRQLGARKDPGLRSGRVDHPLARRARAVEHGQPEQLVDRDADGHGVAVGGQRVGHVRHDRDVGVERVARAVGRDRVDPRDRDAALEDLLHLRGALRAVHVEEMVERALVGRIGVADRVGAHGVPAEHGRPRHGEQEDRPVARVVEGVAAHIGALAVGRRHAHLDRARGHRFVLPVDQIGRGVAGHELQLHGREAVRGGDGVAPGDALVEADQRQRHAVERHAVDVHLARNRHLERVEALGAEPWEVRISEQHARGGARGVGSERVGVAADAEASRGWAARTALRSAPASPAPPS